MNTTKQNNIKIVAIWLCFIVITIGLALNMSFCLDAGETWRVIVGIVSFLFLIVETVKFGQWVRAYYVSLDNKKE